MRGYEADQANCKIKKNYDPFNTSSGQNLYTFNP